VFHDLKREGFSEMLLGELEHEMEDWANAEDALDIIAGQYSLI
jgi:hypothetical protein